MDPQEDNHPWAVSNLEEFHFYCCPECDLKEHAKDKFVKHALEHHSESKHHLGKLLIKQEIHAVEENNEKKFSGAELEEGDCVTVKEEFKEQEEEEDEEYYLNDDNEFMENENLSGEAFADGHLLQDELTPLRKLKVTSKYTPYFDIGKYETCTIILQKNVFFSNYWLHTIFMGKYFWIKILPQFHYRSNFGKSHM